MEASNPRVFGLQMRSTKNHLERLGQLSGAYVQPLPDSFESDLQEIVRQFGGEEKSWRHEGLALAMLRDVANEGGERLEALSEAITRAYFSHLPAAHAVGSMASGRLTALPC